MCVTIIVAKFLNLDIINLPYLKGAINPDILWRIDALLICMLAIFSYVYFTTYWRDRKGWVREQGLDGGKLRALIGKIEELFQSPIPHEILQKQFNYDDYNSKEKIEEKNPAPPVRKILGTLSTNTNIRIGYISLKREIDELPDQIDIINKIAYRYSTTTDIMIPIVLIISSVCFIAIPLFDRAVEVS